MLLILLACGFAVSTVPAAEALSYAEIVAMLDAGVDPSIVLLQARSTDTRLDLDAGRIVRLHEMGASKELLAWLIGPADGQKEATPGGETPAAPQRVDGISWMPSEASRPRTHPPAPAPPETSRTPVPTTSGYPEVVIAQPRVVVPAAPLYPRTVYGYPYRSPRIGHSTSYGLRIGIGHGRVRLGGHIGFGAHRFAPWGHHLRGHRSGHHRRSCR